ncbi:MAG: hypothetical protein JW704_00025, partial [Anaerolineaceae bacterium]|nr:hypothetical protein [Anaerolineaceae bacterium]
MKEEKLEQAESMDNSVVGAPEEPIERVTPIETERTKGHLLDVGPGMLAIDLPAGYIDSNGALHSFAVVREMRGHEEDILASSGPVVGRLSAIITNCIVRLGDVEDRRTIAQATREMSAYDRMAIFLAIRRISLGDFYDCMVTCPMCNVEQHKALDLREVEIIPMPDRMARERVDKLSSGIEVRWHILRA